METQNLIPFEGKPRKIWHNDEWFFSVVDIIEILTGTTFPSRYWQDLKRKSAKAEGQLYDFIVKLKLVGADGRGRPSDCANTEGILRIVMSVPSPKAEPLKLWLAEQGKRAIDEAENPELGFERMTEMYQAKGRSEEWIKNRLQSISTRKELTDEWQKRGVKEGREYSILTAFSEEATRQVTIRDEAQGFTENYDAAQIGGRIGGKARENYEQDTGLKVVSTENFLNPTDTPPPLDSEK